MGHGGRRGSNGWGIPRLCGFVLILLFLSPPTGFAQETHLGPYGWLELPADYRSNRVSTQFYFNPGKTVTVAKMEGAGCVKHFWVTFARALETSDFGMDLIFRVYTDGKETPDIEVPISAFFCQFHRLPVEPIDSTFFQVTKGGGFNSYLPMPFADGMEITVENQTGKAGDLYFQADYHEYESLAERLRLYAVYRRVNPARLYDQPYLLGWGEGRGFLAGMSVGMQVYDKADAWYHHGGDRILLDGGTAHPTILNGIGGEDFFGDAFGMRAYSQGPVGVLYYNEKDTAPEFVHISGVEEAIDGRDASISDEPYLTFSAFRFFYPDTVRFHHDFSASFGSFRNDMQSVLYWYQDPPPEQFVTLAAREDRKLDARVSEDKYTLLPEPLRTWDIAGPFNAETRKQFEHVEFPEKAIDFSHEEKTAFGVYAYAEEHGYGTVYTKWKRGIPQLNHFIDLRPYFHSRNPTNFGFPFHTSAYAITEIQSDEEKQATIRLGHDDWLRLWLNDELIYDGDDKTSFESVEIPATLQAGKNNVMVKAANKEGFNLRAWIFQFEVIE